jgi:hypothetical protein
MPKRQTRKMRGGGGFDAADKERVRENLKRVRKTEDQIIHTLSQLNRFVQCFKTGDTSRLLQFAYNLGRLQELCHETTHPDIWWKPIEKCVDEKDWKGLEDYVEEIRKALGVDYDPATLAKGC